MYLSKNVRSFFCLDLFGSNHSHPMQPLKNAELLVLLCSSSRQNKNAEKWSGFPWAVFGKPPGVHKVWMILSDIGFEFWVRPGVKLDDPCGSPPAGDIMILWWPPSHFRKK